MKGTNAHEGSTSGSIEAKYADVATGTILGSLNFTTSTQVRGTPCLNFSIILSSTASSMLILLYHRAGLTLTQGWNTLNVLNTKLELDDKTLAPGLKAEALTDFVPSKQMFGAKLNLFYKQPNFHSRAFFDFMKGPTASVDAVLGHEGFLVGAEAGYDVQKAALTRYSAAVGFTSLEYSAAVTASNSLSVFAASYYHKVNSQVEAGAKATWDSKKENNVGLEVAGKYRMDPVSFAKVIPSHRIVILSMLLMQTKTIRPKSMTVVSLP